MPGVIQKSQFCRVSAVPKGKGCLGARRSLSPIVQLHATGVNALETGYVLSRGCWIGSWGRAPSVWDSVDVWSTPARVLWKNQVAEPINPSQTLPGCQEVYFQLSLDKEVGSWIILETPPSLFSQEEVMLLLSISALPTWRATCHLGDLGAPPYYQLYCWCKARMNIWGIPYLRMPSSIHGELSPLASSWMSSTMCEMMKRCIEINTDSTEDSNTSN